MAYRLITKNQISNNEYLVVNISNKLFQVKFNKKESDGISLYFDFLVANTSEFTPDYEYEMDMVHNIFDEIKDVKYHWAGSILLYSYDVPYLDKDYKWRVFSSGFLYMDTEILEHALTDALTRLLIDYDIKIDEDDSFIARGIFDSYLKHNEKLPDCRTLSNDIYNYIKKKAVKGTPTLIVI